MCVIAARAQGIAESAAAGAPSDPAEAHGWLSYAYIGVGGAILLALAVPYAFGRRPLALGPERVRWPLAPAPSVFLMLLLMVAGAAAASAAMQALGAEAGEDVRSRAIASMANSGTQLLLVAGVCWAIGDSRVARPPLQSGSPADADARSPMGRARAAALGAAVMAIGWPLVQAGGVIASTVQRALTGVDAPDTAHRTLEAMGQSGDAAWIAATALVAVVLAPLAEEILYRGALQQALHGLGIPRVLSIAGTSALFAAAHWGSLVGGSEAGALTMLFLLGLMFGWSYERTGSLWAPFTAHAMFNAANLAIFLLQR